MRLAPIRVLAGWRPASKALFFPAAFVRNGFFCTRQNRLRTHGVQSCSAFLQEHQPPKRTFENIIEYTYGSNCRQTHVSWITDSTSMRGGMNIRALSTGVGALVPGVSGDTHFAGS